MREDEPMLGLATTEQLFREIISRMTHDFSYSPSWLSVRKALMLAEMLGGLSATEREYRTVDG